MAPAGGKGKDASANGGIRLRILESAKGLFAKKGFAATSIREIAQSAKVTNPMIYYYFGSKEELFMAVLGQAMETFDTLFEALLEADIPYEEKLVELFMMHFESVVQDPDLSRLFVYTFFGPDRDRLGLAVEDFGQNDCFKGLIEQGVELGVLRSDEQDVQQLHLEGLVHMPVMKLMAGEPIELDRQVAHRLVKLFLDGAGARQEGS
mgnify:CR=1 FL=1